MRVSDLPIFDNVPWRPFVGYNDDFPLESDSRQFPNGLKSILLNKRKRAQFSFETVIEIILANLNFRIRAFCKT